MTTVRSDRLKERTVHLIDLENAAGSGHVTEQVAEQVRASYLATGLVRKHDHVIVGVSHHNVFAAKYGWSEARVVLQSGPNGADVALQEVMAAEQLETRFGACIVVTGDGGFAHSVAALIGRGLPVGVVAPAGGTSAALKLAASAVHEMCFLPDAAASWSA